MRVDCIKFFFKRKFSVVQKALDQEFGDLGSSYNSSNNESYVASASALASPGFFAYERSNTGGPPKAPGALAFHDLESSVREIQ